MSEQERCALCLRPLGINPTELTVKSTKPEERKLKFCADASGCRRTAFSLYVEPE